MNKLFEEVFNEAYDPRTGVTSIDIKGDKGDKKEAYDLYEKLSSVTSYLQGAIIKAEKFAPELIPEIEDLFVAAKEVKDKAHDVWEQMR